MSEPLIPKRWQSEIDQDGDTLLRKCCQELGAAEAKVAGLEAKFAEAERLRLYNLDQVADLLKQNALWQADNREKAIAIAQLAEELDRLKTNLVDHKFEEGYSDE